MQGTTTHHTSFDSTVINLFKLPLKFWHRKSRELNLVDSFSTRINLNQLEAIPRETKRFSQMSAGEDSTKRKKRSTVLSLYSDDVEKLYKTGASHAEIASIIQNRHKTEPITEEQVKNRINYLIQNSKLTKRSTDVENVAPRGRKRQRYCKT
jgi:hypothetical protein